MSGLGADKWCTLPGTRGLQKSNPLCLVNNFVHDRKAAWNLIALPGILVRYDHPCSRRKVEPQEGWQLTLTLTTLAPVLSVARTMQ